MTIDMISSTNPWPLFKDWFSQATHSEVSYPEAMMLATADAAGGPSIRAVLMKSYDDRGLVFHTNRESRKGQQIEENKKAALCFYWKSLQKQIRLEGLIEETSEAESDAYFKTRARMSQIGAWASEQSRSLPERGLLQRRVEELEEMYEGKEIPRPPYWGGYRLIPLFFEFWQEEPFRLHDRIVYCRKSVTHGWVSERLQP